MQSILYEVERRPPSFMPLITAHRFEARILNDVLCEIALAKCRNLLKGRKVKVLPCRLVSIKGALTCVARLEVM